MRICFYGYLDAVELFCFSMSSKGGKLNKAQKAKQQQEEEERRLQEEEEARLHAEKEERERLERERKEKEQERLELKDQERREDELNELRHLLEENHTAVTTWKTDAVEKAKWERYMHCDGTPDPAVQQDLNTHISLWRDDPEVNITLVLKQCHLALQLMEELEALLRDVTDPQECHKYQDGLINLQELIHSKHLLTTEEILKSASMNIDTETGNMQTVVKDVNITLCLWANLKKNPRFRDLNFGEAGLGFELPKQLAVSHIAVRLLHTHYDHLSLLARMAHPRMHTPSLRSLACGEEVPADIDVPEQEETKRTGEAKEDIETQQQRVDKEVQSIQGFDGSKSAASQESSRNSAQPAEGRVSQIQTQMEALSSKMPSPTLPDTPKRQPHHTGSEGDLTETPIVQLTMMDRSECVQAVDLMQYTPLGGVFYCDVFHLPPQTHQVNGWEIRQLLDEGLQVFPYPLEKSNLDDTEALTCPPVGVSVTLPDSVVFLETPQVARWDAAVKQWRMDSITDLSYEEKEAKISFKMDSFQPFVLMQETYANLPFLSWELRPLGQDAALFTVNGALIDLSITIQGNQCMLQLGQERGLSHLIGKWMSGPILQRAMLNAGINIFVNEYTDKYIITCGKDPLTEHAAYEQMALFASACAFSWSKWNAKCGAEHLVMQACEHHDPVPVPKDSWSLYLLGAQRSQKLEITEKSAEFSPDYYPGSEFHSTFIHMLQDNMSTDGIARTRESNNLFVDTVQSLLCATRPLMYS
ncbi:dynein intermediate chain CFAP94, axonemal isoform X2 [Perca fluviatilis]|uniref:dynein intermediate chain CFAP94, axonemal isoform X2 n=1 Tax=Perca fluviatilis TaxID=8168 RepID=UPI00196520A5|nr:dynein intermediate chain CFAP94, axonemal isoform X2 [Perca fluviatilis]